MKCMYIWIPARSGVQESRSSGFHAPENEFLNSLLWADSSFRNSPHYGSRSSFGAIFQQLSRIFPDFSNHFIGSQIRCSSKQRSVTGLAKKPNNVGENNRSGHIQNALPGGSDAYPS